jgi:hypothetical protein
MRDKMSKTRANFTRSEEINFRRYLRTHTVTQRGESELIGDEKGRRYAPKSKTVGKIELELIQVHPGHYVVRVPERLLKSIETPTADFLDVIVGHRTIRLSLPDNPIHVGLTDTLSDLRQTEERYRNLLSSK